MIEKPGHVFDVPPNETGDWAGWVPMSGFDAFEDRVGPYYYREEAGGRMIAGLRLEARHMNSYGTVHGGCLVTLADSAMFIIAKDILNRAPCATVSLTSEFVGAARLGQLVTATGEVVKAGGSLIFVRGLIRADDDPTLVFTGVIRKFRTPITA